MKKFWMCLLLSAVCALGGCSYSMGSIDSLLQPPRLTEEQNEIYLALKRETGDDIKLVYPQRGNYRSAFILTNLDDEPTEEAVVFYQQNAVSASSTTAVRMKVLDKQDGAWIALYDISMESAQINDVTIMRVGTGVPLLAVGLGYTADGGNLLRVFEFQEGSLTEVYSQGYQAKKIFDFDGDDRDEIFYIDRVSEAQVLARLMNYESHTFSETSQVLMNPEMPQVSYFVLTDGYLRNGQRALYIDVSRSSELISTEIVIYDTAAGGMQNLTYTEGLSQHYPIDRQRSIYCRDLNNDGVIEVPGLSPMLGYQEDGSAVYLTSWYHFLDGEFVRQKASYVNSSLGYLLEFPDKWIGRVSASSAGENEMLFYEYQEGDNPVKTELLYFKVMTKSEWESKRENSNYELVDAHGQNVYLAKIPKNSSGLRVTLAQVKEYFSLYLS